MNLTDQVVYQCPGFINAYKELYQEGNLNFHDERKAIKKELRLLNKYPQLADHNCRLLSLRNVLQVHTQAMTAYCQNSWYEKVANIFRSIFGKRTPLQKANCLLSRFYQDTQNMSADDIKLQDQRAMRCAQLRMITHCAKNGKVVNVSKEGKFYGELKSDPEKNCHTFHPEIKKSVFKSDKSLLNFIRLSTLEQVLKAPVFDENEIKGESQDGERAIIVRTKNRPKECYTTLEDTCFISKKDVCPDFRFNPYYTNEETESFTFKTRLGRGKCAAMCDLFLYLYLETKEHFKNDPCGQMAALGKLFEDGAGLEAIVLQALDPSKRLELLSLSNLTFDEPMATGIDWAFKAEDHEQMLEKLKPETYRITLPGHAILYIKIKEDLSFYFDPNLGVVRITGNNQGKNLYHLMDCSWNNICEPEQKIDSWSSFLWNAVVYCYEVNFYIKPMTSTKTTAPSNQAVELQEI